MQAAVLSGIRPSFPSLSRSAGQITHVLLTRSPLEYPRKGLSVRLACVKHAASVRPEPGSNSPNKNPSPKSEAKMKSEKPDTTPKNWHQKNNHTSHTGSAKSVAQKTTTKTKPPNTLLSSQTTPSGRATNLAAIGRLVAVRTARDPPKWNFPLGHRRALRPSRVATTRSSYASRNAESSILLDGVLQVSQRH
jgi:hypothetical protein